MLSKPKAFVRRWIINTVAVLIAAHIVSPGIRYDRFGDLVVASLLLGLLNAFVRPLLLLLSLPLLVVTLGLFTLVINAGLLCFVGWLVPGFHVNSFAAAFLGALIISLVSLSLNTLFGRRTAPIEYQRPNPRRRGPPRDGQGPVIDV